MYEEMKRGQTELVRCVVHEMVWKFYMNEILVYIYLLNFMDTA